MNTPQQGPATWTSPAFPQQPRATEDGREEPQFQSQYAPGMTYYPNQTRKLATPPASAPPITTPPAYYPRPDYLPVSAPPQFQQQYGYYSGYSYDPNDYPRQPSGSTLPVGERSPADFSPSYQYDPRLYRPQIFYPQHPQHQYVQWSQGHYADPSAVSPPKAEGSKKRTEPDTKDVKAVKKSKKKKVKVEEVFQDEYGNLPKPPSKSLLNPPRQAQSAWQLFFADELNRAKSALSPESSAKLNVAQVAKDAGLAYGLLEGEQKAYYMSAVANSKAQYAKDLLAWQESLTPEDIRLENAFRTQQRKDGKSRKANLKDPHAPKKPLSAYFLFLKTIREDGELRASIWGSETETTKQSVLAAERWRGLTDVEKKPYLQRAEAEKAGYETTRLLYEEDSAARARGEHFPARRNPNVNTPASTKVPSPEAPNLAELKPPLSPDAILHSPIVFQSPQLGGPADSGSGTDGAGQLGVFQSSQLGEPADGGSVTGGAGRLDELPQWDDSASPLSPTFEQLAGFTALDSQQEEWSDLHQLMEQHDKEKPDKESDSVQAFLALE